MSKTLDDYLGNNKKSLHSQQTGYKETPIGRIPKEWKVAKLENVGKVITGGTPPTSENAYWNGDIPFITPGDMQETKYTYNTQRYITLEGANRVGKILPEDTVIVVCIGSTIGKVAITYKESVTNQQINGIICKKEVDANYVYYAISFRANLLKSYSGIAAVPIVKKSLFELFKIPLPPLPEQQKIAEILSMVDTSIETVDKAIAQTGRLKSGMMRELLTKGMGHTKFKDTKIGRIPKEWEVTEFDAVLKLIRNGLVCRQNKEGEGYPISRIETISNEKIDPNKVGYVNSLKEEEIREYQLIAGDILFSHINSVAHIGKTALYENCPKLLIHGMNLLVLRSNRQKIDPYFLLHLLKLYRKRGIFKNIAKKAVNQASINQKEVGRVRISLPPLPEQHKIAEILSTVDKKLELENERKKKLERIKRGLMNDLLTGKRRVKCN